MSVPPLERVAGEQGKESLSFPNAELGAKLLRINGRTVSVLPQAAGRRIGEVYLGQILNSDGWLDRYQDEESLFTPDNTFEVKVGTTSYGGRFLRIACTENASLKQLRIERLNRDELNKKPQWIEVTSENPGLSSAYWPEEPIGIREIPTVNPLSNHESFKRKRSSTLFV